MPYEYTDFREVIAHGDDEGFDFVVKLGGVAQDITGWTEFWFTGKVDPERDTDSGAKFQVTLTGTGIVKTNAAAGQLRATLRPADWKNVPRKTVWLQVDLQGKDAAGKIHTLTTGRFRIIPDVTRAS